MGLEDKDQIGNNHGGRGKKPKKARNSYSIWPSNSFLLNDRNRRRILDSFIMEESPQQGTQTTIQVVWIKPMPDGIEGRQTPLSTDGYQKIKTSSVCEQDAEANVPQDNSISQQPEQTNKYSNVADSHSA